MIQLLIIIVASVLGGWLGLKISCLAVEWYERKLAEGFQRVVNATPRKVEIEK